MARKVTSAVMVALMGASPSIMALGLGELDSNSALNEPLSARIPLRSMSDSDIRSVHVSLASPAAFERIGLDRPFYLSRLQFKVKLADGKPYIFISTDKPVREPFLDFLLEVRWPQGHLQREYTVLLDPPHYGLASSSAPVPSDHAVVTQALPLSDAATHPYVSMPVSAASEGGAGGHGASGPTRYGPVQANQTLWDIADQVRPSDDITIYQMMQALLVNNPAAFIDGNINALRKGVVLRVPPRAEIASINAELAAQRMQAQLRRWQRRHSGVAAGAPAVQASAQTNAKGQGNDNTVEAAPASTTPSAAGRLDLVAVQESVGARTEASLTDQTLAPTQQNIAQLQHQLALAEERNARLKSANAQLRQQVSALKAELANLKSLINVPLEGGVSLPVTETAEQPSGSDVAQAGEAINSGNRIALAEPSRIPSSAHLETAASGAIREENVNDDTALVEASESASLTAIDAAAGSDAVTEAPGSAEPGSTSTLASSMTEARSRRAASLGEASAHGTQFNKEVTHQTIPQRANRSLKARLLAYLPLNSNRLVLFGSGLLLAVLGLLWVIRRRSVTAAPQQHSSKEGVVPSVKPGETAAKPGRIAARPQGGTTATGGTLLDHVEAHIVGGRYAKAQSLLDRTLGEHPGNPQLRLKLLEVLAAQDDRNGFEAEAQVLHTQVADESDTHWQQALQIARRIAPDHPLFGGETSPDEATAAQSLKSMDTVPGAATESTSIPTSQAMGETDPEVGVATLAFDQPQDRVEEASQPADKQPESTVLEFDLDETEAFAHQQEKESVTAAADEEGPSDEGDDFGALDFSLPEEWDAPSQNLAGHDDDSSHSDAQATPQPSASLQSDVPDMDKVTEEAADDELMDLDEVGTKLDLARAYLDMGDSVGARSLLNEVVVEGGAAQQSEAKDLLQQLG